MKSYRFFIINTHYPAFTKYFYQKYPNCIDKNYKEQKRLLDQEHFGVSQSYVSNLKKLGHSAVDVIANNEILQKQWAKKNHVNYSKLYLPNPQLSLLAFFKKTKLANKIKKIIYKKSWIYQILFEQIKYYKPDILYVLDPEFLSNVFLKQVSQYTKIKIGQIACPLPASLNNLKKYDLIITSAPHFINKFKKHGIKAEYLKLGFEPRITKIIGPQKKKYNCTFIGGLSHCHENRIKLLEKISNKVDIDIWGYGQNILPKSFSIIKKHHGEIWGQEMYKILAQSKIIINSHIDVAGNFAGNLRLFEATGMGSMLITDMKSNLKDLFKIGREIETYSSPTELVEKTHYYLKHDDERERIARDGQKRTLQEHIWQLRMQELLDILEEI